MSRPGESSPHRLLAEGTDDQFSVIHLMEKYGMNWNQATARLPFVHDCKGIDNLLEQVPVALKSFETLGIVLDANASLTPRWNRLKKMLATAGMPLPNAPVTGGFVGAGTKSPTAKVGIWFMPDNAAAGTLEDFLLTLVPADDVCFALAQNVTGEAQKLGAPFKAIHRSKAELHTWLSWQDSPGSTFGLSIKTGVLKSNSAVAEQFAVWFKKLFS